MTRARAGKETRLSPGPAPDACATGAGRRARPSAWRTESAARTSLPSRDTRGSVRPAARTPRAGESAWRALVFERGAVGVRRSARATTRAGTAAGISSGRASPRAGTTAGLGAAARVPGRDSDVTCVEADTTVGSTRDPRVAAESGREAGATTTGTAVTAGAGLAAGAVGAGTGAGEEAGGGLDPGGVGAGADTGAGAGAGVGAGAGTGAVTGGGAVARAGSSDNGSRYPWSCAVRRTPRWTYGCATSASPLGPTVPTGVPSETAAPTLTPIEPRCVSVTE